MSKYQMDGSPVTPTQKTVELADGEAKYLTLDAESRKTLLQVMADFEKGDGSDYSNEIAFNGDLRINCLFDAVMTKDGRRASEVYEADAVKDFIKALSGADLAQFSTAVLEDAGFMANDQLVSDMEAVRDYVVYHEEESIEEDKDDEDEITEETNNYAM